MIHTQPSRADFYLHPWRDHSFFEKKPTLEVSTLLTQTTRNWNASGIAEIPIDFQSYSRFHTDFLALYGLNPHWGIYGRVNLHYIDLKSGSRFGTQVGFGDSSFGITFQPFLSSVGKNLHFQFQADIPTYLNETAERHQKPYLGDGTFDFTSGVFFNPTLVSSAAHQITASLGVGYTYRTGGFSSALPGSLLLRYTYRPTGLTVGAFGDWVYSLKTDPLATYPTLPVGTTLSGSGGSFLSGAINPSHLQLGAQLGYQVQAGKLILISASKTLMGQNAPLTTQYGFHFCYEFGSGTQNPTRPAPAPTTQPTPPVTTPESRQLNDSPPAPPAPLIAQVLHVNDRLNLVKINRGRQDRIEVGQVFEIVSVKPDGSELIIARAQVSHLRETEAALEITEYSQSTWIEPGFKARPVRN